MSDALAPISVIVPCRNAESTLGEALESVFAQTVPPAEVLVIDDHSEDGSIAMARRYGPKVQVLGNPQRGPGAARQIGVARAAGTYVAYVDADDRLEPTKHEKQLAVLESRDPHTVVHTGATKFGASPLGGEPDVPDGAEAVGRCLPVIFERNPVCGASIMMRRSVILELGNYDPELFGAEDYHMSLLASTCCDFVHLPEPLYHRRRHADNVTNRASLMAYYHWLAQEKFRLRHPDAFARIPADSVRQQMIEPVLRAVREAHWRRDGRDYARLLRLAIRLAPTDPAIRQLRRRRWCPMTWLRAWDRLIATRVMPDARGA